MQGCGPITLPSGAELDGAPQKIKDRINAHIRSDWLNAIRSIDEGDKEGVAKVEGESIDIRLGRLNTYAQFGHAHDHTPTVSTWGPFRPNSCPTLVYPPILDRSAGAGDAAGPEPREKEIGRFWLRLHVHVRACVCACVR